MSADHLSSIASAFANHLWQSTWFAAVVFLLTLALRKNHAGIRYKLWLIASVKFLLPFSLLIDAGRQVDWPANRAEAPAALISVVEGISQPFSTAVSPDPVAAPGTVSTAIDSPAAASRPTGFRGF